MDDSYNNLQCKTLVGVSNVFARLNVTKIGHSKYNSMIPKFLQKHLSKVS